MSVPDDPGDNTFCMLLTTIGAASLAIWLYLLLARGGFWRMRPDVVAARAFGMMIDEALAQKAPPTAEEDAERLIAQAQGLLSPAEEGIGFARRYFDIMQREAAAVLAHRDMLQVMNGLKH